MIVTARAPSEHATTRTAHRVLLGSTRCAVSRCADSRSRHGRSRPAAAVRTNGYGHGGVLGVAFSGFASTYRHHVITAPWERRIYPTCGGHSCQRVQRAPCHLHRRPLRALQLLDRSSMMPRRLRRLAHHSPTPRSRSPRQALQIRRRPHRLVRSTPRQLLRRPVLLLRLIPGRPRHLILASSLRPRCSERVPCTARHSYPKT